MASSTMIFTVLLVSLCLIAPLTQATKVTYCDVNEDYAVKVKKVDINPDPVVSGKPATFSISATAGERISGGKLVIDVSYFGFFVHSETRDLCGETSCPVSAGDFVVSHSQQLPGFTPPGKYKLKMTMYDSENNKLTCINFGFSIKFGSSVADS